MEDVVWFEKSTNGRSFGPLGLLGLVAPGLAARLAFRLFFRPQVDPPSPAAQAFLATGEARRIGELATWTWGPAAGVPQRGRALVVHGWSGRGSQLRAVVEALRTRGFEVVAFDGPGHGATPGKVGSIAHMARAISAIAVAKPPDVIVAHSMGAAAVTVAIADGSVTPSAVAFYGPNVHPLGFLGKVLHKLGADERVARRFQAYTESRIGRSFASVDPRRALAAMRARLLVVHAEDDKEVPVREGVAFAEGWPGARLHLVPTLGHRRILHDPALAALVADFLAEA